MMGLELQGFTQILPSLLATKFVWFISSRYGSAKGSLTPSGLVYEPPKVVVSPKLATKPILIDDSSPLMLYL